MCTSVGGSFRAPAFKTAVAGLGHGGRCHPPFVGSLCLGVTELAPSADTERPGADHERDTTGESRAHGGVAVVKAVAGGARGGRDRVVGVAVDP